jgi:hypothetical protein
VSSRPAAILCLLLFATLPGCQEPRVRAHADAGSPAPPPPPARLDSRRASRFARLALGCLGREYPNKPGAVYERDAQLRPPREVTPVFHGCFDWHSAVHGHWTLVRLLKTAPSLPEAPAIRALLRRQLTPERLAVELAYLKEDRNRTFERPYGWAWLLRLAVELERWQDPEGRVWARAIRPLAAHLVLRASAYLPRLSAPVRDGTHASTAFAMVQMLDYARGVGETRFARLLEARARELYGRDVACPTHFEPSGEDFISPCLVEADLMRRVLAPSELRRWLDRFLPSPGSRRFAPLAAPTPVRDPTDPKIGHLIGLAFQRAWSLRGIADALPANDRRRGPYLRIAALHTDAALGLIERSGYGGEHWLASFATYLLSAAGPTVGTPVTR